MRFCRNLVGVQFGWHNGDEVLKHVISWRKASSVISRYRSRPEHINKKQRKNLKDRLTIGCDFLGAIQSADESRKDFAKGQVVDPVRKVVSCNATDQNKGINKY